MSDANVFLGRRLPSRGFEAASLVFMSPAGLLLFALFLAPVGYSFYLGLTNLQLIGPNSVNFHFTGLFNVQAMLRDREFYHSLWVTLLFVVGSGAIGSTAGGLALAMLIQKGHRVLGGVVGGAAMLACTLPPVTVAVMWKATTIADGIFPFLLGMPKVEVLYTYPMTVVSVANVWWLCGLSMLMFSAALRNISNEMIEAAIMERATSIQRFFRIILPSLRPTIVTSALLMCLLSFGNFTLVFLMTGGGPANATNILPLYSYMQGFTFHRLAFGAMLGNVIVLMSALLGLSFVLISSYSARRQSTLTKLGSSDE
ncbi:sugar ABC transporter permease [Mesorhizobium sp. VK24D]|uniref:Sugar ABC transporter permease n=1 Tax=Mesorhizobium album TaxID=3072314 RepID=A0ABU4Y6K3_9HYPH|nr:sugar ABC transporter permease [Mesorhizobium sp. VK24D]MDX8482565.1 sugar ABC transporter permease [Mesorhizobium sp. VK24D]